MVYGIKGSILHRKSTLQHIPMDLKSMGGYPKKVEKMMPLEKFKNYFLKIVYGVHKVVGKYGSEMVYGAEFIVSRDVQDSYHGGEYDYVKYILEKMKENTKLAQNGEMKNFFFPHYSFLMHLILYRNVGYFSSDFINHTSDANG